ncbi:MAG: GTPase HflX [Deltaproteobacteria bacterium RBG_16_47_11]|nr:MAG: GTPase HflX [Deltaproteobacteria bacterium RBG_16_47_11]
MKFRKEGQINRAYGNLIGLKPGQIRKIEHIYRRRIPPHRVVSQDIARLLTEISDEIRRQVGILVGRRGSIEIVIVGDQRSITIPDLSRYRTGTSRLRGLRFIHTHLQGELLTQEDLADLALLRLDMMVVLGADGDGFPEFVQSAYLLPDNREKKAWEINPPVSLGHWDLDFLRWIQSLEDEFQRRQRSFTIKGSSEKAILLRVSHERRERIEQSMEELKELAQSSGVYVVDSIIQRPQRISPTTLMGEGKLQELLIQCMQSGVDLIIFDQNLTAGQTAAISDRTELRVLDRTQLILDIFAQRAHTVEGKIQVELAQLKYILPRLGRKTLALSRLTGGIGGRGPGETKLEIDRRRVRDRIHLLEKELEKMRKGREQRRARRTKTGIPIVSIIGYTNAGKSTLFNLLTQSQSLVENKLFATLDPATRRLRCPVKQDWVVTDTVGFIKDLPRDLMVAFRPTFDELQESNLLIHLVDISSPHFEEHIETVEKILSELNLDHLPRLLVFNKEDRLRPPEVEAICRKYKALAISSLRPESLERLFHAIQQELWTEGGSGRLPFGRLTNDESFDISDKTHREARSEDEIPS